MPQRPCLSCGILVATASYCAQCRPAAQPTRQTAGRRNPSVFRQAVLRAAGYRCEALLNGVRCDVTDPALLEAHHVVGVVEGGTDRAENGRALCRVHHRQADTDAR